MTDAELMRLTIAPLADALVPAYGALPAAGAPGILDPWLDDHRSTFEAIARVLEGDPRANDGPAAALAALEAADPGLFEAFGTLVVSAYYSHPEIAPVLGTGTLAPEPAVADEALLAELTAGLRERPSRP